MTAAAQRESDTGSNETGRPLAAHFMMRHYLLTVSLIVGIFVAIFGREFLPSTYFNDDRFIQQLLNRTAQSDGGSFAFTATAYSLLGLSSQPLVAGMVSYGFFLVLLFRSVSWSRLCVGDLRIFWVACGAILLSSVYLAQYSKEFLVIGLCLFFITARRHWLVGVIWVGLALLYAHLVRDYWYLVVALYLGFRIIVWKWRSGIALVLAVMGFYGALVVAFQILLGVPLVNFRIIVQIYLDASTMIVDPVLSPNIAFQVLNVVLVLLSLLLPYPLVLSLQPLQLVLASYIVFFWTAMLRYIALLYCKAASRGHALQLSRPLCLIIAFVMVQSIFEPDYGSYIKHLLPMVPVCLFMMNRVSEAIAPGSGENRSGGEIAQ